MPNDTNNVSVPELFQSIGELTVDRDAWRRRAQQAEQLAAHFEAQVGELQERLEAQQRVGAGE